jgi:multidrug resistance protein MdtO
MATQAAQLQRQLAGRTGYWRWFLKFVRWEVLPYPGRLNTVIRMMVAATLVMLIVMTFRIPNAALAGYYAILLARENLAATWRQGYMIVLGFVAGSVYTLLGMMLLRGFPITHFIWVIATLFLLFFVMRTATNYGAAAGFSFIISNALPVWDRPLPSEVQVAGTLWPALVIAVGAGVTVATEAVYRIFDSSDPLLSSIDDLLLTTRRVVQSFADAHPPPEQVINKILQYDMIGTGRLRTALARQGVDPTRRAHLSALIALTGRLVELAANLDRTAPRPGEEDAGRLLKLSVRLEEIRTDLRQSGIICTSSPALGGEASATVPNLPDMERTVDLITEVFHRGEIEIGHPNGRALHSHSRFFLPDAFQNREYLRFAFAGCLAASVCYVLYNALDWPMISTAVLTCVVTALSTVGTSLQKQVLRIAGYVVGGLIIGLPAQILILPHIDTIFGFALFFAAGTAIAAWFATSSPRLSYFGLQTALAFYFIHLQDFQIQTDLSIARDRVIGVLLGILATGFIFDRFGAKSDADQMRRQFVQNLRMLAQLGLCLVERDSAKIVPQIKRLRSQLNDSFASLASQLDALRLESEFSARHEEDLAAREHLQQAQPAARSIFVLELDLLQHRQRRESSVELTQQQNEALDRFLNDCSDALMYIAACVAHEPATAPARFDAASARRVLQAFEKHVSPSSSAIFAICQQMITSLLSLSSVCPTW